MVQLQSPPPSASSSCCGGGQSTYAGGSRSSRPLPSSIKTVIVGASGCGKSSISMRYVKKSFDDAIEATIGAAYISKQVTLKGRSVKVDLWDTAGQERFRSLAPMYYRSAMIAYIVYDITSSSSFKEVERWVAELVDQGPPNMILVIVGNKADKESQRQVSKKELADCVSELRKAREGRNAVVGGECSAKTGDNVEALIHEGLDLVHTADLILVEKAANPHIVVG
eukprot:TRINITY_DN2_c0_g3_i1.p1 TRINITY_DN2_c0_g3~~TRINITY_DN2_c0_g3_i1.p1  ORF type:complete len:225 (+),score=30.19 TRINITY_DN2_c0_g3_i1:53-727(+)